MTKSCLKALRLSGRKVQKSWAQIQVKAGLVDIFISLYTRKRLQSGKQKEIRNLADDRDVVLMFLPQCTGFVITGGDSTKHVLLFNYQEHVGNFDLNPTQLFLPVLCRFSVLTRGPDFAGRLYHLIGRALTSDS